jgi:hypothetical protein
MDWNLLRLLTSLMSPIKWGSQLVSNRTRIKFRVPSADDCTIGTIPIKDSGNGSGLLVFGVSTYAKDPIEITRVEVHYSTPFQLFDPGNMGFFVGGGSPDMGLPFCMAWDGRAQVRADVQQAFGLSARFAAGTNESRIRFAIHAKRVHSTIGGYVETGKLQVTSKDFLVKLVRGPISGIPVPPRSHLTTPQPFIIQSEVSASAPLGDDISLVVHTRDANGVATSTTIKKPNIKPATQDSRDDP